MASFEAEDDRRVRAVIQVRRGQPTSDGAGVRLNRMIGTASIPDLDPFLLLDEFRSDDPGAYIAGFPSHPHRGFETVTYMLAGKVRHRDNHGHVGVVEPGGVQWMTAGRGIVHSEMPEQSSGLLWGFQLWLNLPAAEKMTAPQYQEFDGGELPEIEPTPGVRLRLIAGEVAGRRGPVAGVSTAPVLIDVRLAAGTRLQHDLPATHSAFAYVYDGEATIGADASPTPVAVGHLAVLGQGDAVVVRNRSGADVGMLIAAARPLGEPVVRQGPFVMNTRAEIAQAIDDFNAGRF